jgi:hypothetical protein
MSDPFQAAKLCLNTANRHINNFMIETAIYLGNSKNTHIVDLNSEPGQRLYKIRFTEPISLEMNGIAADAVTNIRDVLDNAVYASIIASKTAIRKLKKIKFPFGDTADQVRNEITANVDLHPDIADILVNFKPEARRNNSLWTINYLANSKKHRWNLRPFPVSAPNVSLNIGFLMITQPGGGISLMSKWDGLKNELTYLGLPAGATGNFKTNVGFDITFDEPETIRNASALGVLRQFAHEAQGVLMAIEAECRRIGWVA